MNLGSGGWYWPREVARPVTVDLSEIANPFIFVTECLRNGSESERASLARAMTIVWARTRNTTAEKRVNALFYEIWEEL